MLPRPQNFCALLLATLTFGSAPVFAQSGDAVVVLYNGPVDTVEVFDLSVANEAQRLGDRRILPQALGPLQVADLKILPDGSHLLANVDGRGAVVTSPTGAEVRWTLDPQRRQAGIDAASAYTFFAPGEPSLVVSADSEASTVTLRNTAQPNVAWYNVLRLTTARGDIAQTIALPGNRVATAVNWLTAGIYGVVVTSTDPDGARRDTLNVTHAEAPADSRIVPELGQTRDLVGLGDDRLLVTMRYGLLVLDADGNLEDHIDLGELRQANGELASARVLPDGLWAIATFEPGLWVQPHVNHRVHWFDPATRAIVATSDPLRRAPLRVEAYQGIGGTGTIDYDGGLNLIQQGDPEAVDLVDLVVPPTISQGREMTVVARIKNNGVFPVGLQRVVVRAGPGTCATVTPRLDVASASSVALNPEQVFSWSGTTAVGSSFEVGPWCAYAQAVDQLGVLRDVGEPVSFEVAEASSSTGSTIEVSELPTNVPVDGDVGLPDAGGDAGEVDPGGGCCATAPRPHAARDALLAALLALAAVRITRRR